MTEIDLGKPLSREQEPQFAELCRDTRAGFADAVDLVLIHNEHDVKGNQPRKTLNPLTVLLAVAAWERFVVDLRAIAVGSWSEPGKFGKKKRESVPQPAWLGTFDNPHKAGHARQQLAHLSGGRLPEAWSVRSFEGWSGKRPTAPKELVGTEIPALAEEADAWIRLRNAVAHRAMAQDEERAYKESDAENSHTIQAGWARTVLAMFIQLTDQAIAAVGAEAGFDNPDSFRLPRGWFSAEAPAGLRGVTEPEALWGGYALHYP